MKTRRRWKKRKHRKKTNAKKGKVGQEDLRCASAACGTPEHYHTLKKNSEQMTIEIRGGGVGCQPAEDAHAPLCAMCRGGSQRTAAEEEVRNLRQGLNSDEAQEMQRRREWLAALEEEELEVAIQNIEEDSRTPSTRSRRTTYDASPSPPSPSYDDALGEHATNKRYVETAEWMDVVDQDEARYIYDQEGDTQSDGGLKRRKTGAADDDDGFQMHDLTLEQQWGIPATQVFAEENHVLGDYANSDNAAEYSEHSVSPTVEFICYGIWDEDNEEGNGVAEGDGAVPGKEGVEGESAVPEAAERCDPVTELSVEEVVSRIDMADSRSAHMYSECEATSVSEFTESGPQGRNKMHECLEVGNNDEQLRGGGGGAGSGAGGASESSLIEALMNVLKGFGASPQAPSKKGKKRKEKDQKPNEEQTEDAQIADAVIKAIERYQRGPMEGGLIDRLMQVLQTMARKFEKKVKHGGDRPAKKKEPDQASKKVTEEKKGKEEQREKEKGKNAQKDRDDAQGGKGKGVTPKPMDSDWQEVQRRKEKKEKKEAVKARNNAELYTPAWTLGTIISEKELKNTLEAGTALACPKVCLVAEESVDDLTDLVKVHDIKGDVAIFTWNSREDAEEVQIPLVIGGVVRHHALWKSYLMRSDVNKPILSRGRRTVQVTISDFELESLRVQVPQEYVDDETWRRFSESPILVATSLCDREIIRGLNGFRTCCYERSEKILEGYIRVPKEEVPDIIKRSGRRGVFVSRLVRSAARPSQIKWLAVDDLMPRAYLEIAVREADLRGVPIYFRKGGGKALGVEDEAAQILRVWEASQVPRTWRDEELLAALRDAGWVEPGVVRCPRRGCWLFKAKAPEEDAGMETHLLEWRANGTQGCVHIARAPPRNREPGKMEDINTRGWRRQRQAEEDEEGKKEAEDEHDDVAMKQEGPDAEARQKDAKEAGKEEEAGGAASGTKQTAPPGPASVPKKSKTWSDDIKEHDVGGGGACGYLCLVASKLVGRGTKIGDARKTLEPKARTLRAELKSYMSRHEGEFRSRWAPDSAWTYITEGGIPARDWRSWLESTLRPGRWICGMSLVAAAKRMNMHIVVLQSVSGGGTKRWYFPPNDDTTEEVAVLLLRDKHYTVGLKRDGTTFTRAEIGELRSDENDNLQAPRAGARSTSSAPQKGRARSQTTEAEDASSWMSARTSSSRATRRSTPNAASAGVRDTRPRTPNSGKRNQARKEDDCASWLSAGTCAEQKEGQGRKSPAASHRSRSKPRRKGNEAEGESEKATSWLSPARSCGAPRPPQEKARQERKKAQDAAKEEDAASWLSAGTRRCDGADFGQAGAASSSGSIAARKGGQGRAKTSCGPAWNVTGPCPRRPRNSSRSASRTTSRRCIRTSSETRCATRLDTESTSRYRSRTPCRWSSLNGDVHGATAASRSSRRVRGSVLRDATFGSTIRNTPSPRPAGCGTASMRSSGSGSTANACSRLASACL